MSRWPIARYLFSAHTVFLVVCLGVLYLLVGVVLAIVATRTPASISAVDVAGQVLHWLAVGYGYSAVGVLTTMVVHGRTRREFLLQHPVFQLVSAAVLAALITGVYAAEAALYRAAGWTQAMQPHRVFEAGDYPAIFLAYLGMLAVCLMTGTFTGVWMARWEGSGAVALLPAALLLVVAGGANGFFSLPVARFGPDGLPWLAAVCAAVFAVGWALLWVAGRDLPLRTRVAG